MKRSEALKIIDEQYGKYCDDIMRLDLDDEKVMESCAGMLPPAIEGSAKIEEGKDGELFVTIWKWENE